jgi:rfaE bifunctional protein kinase chain/domain
VGDDSGGSALRQHFSQLRVDISGLITEKSWLTPTKTRFLAGWTHTVGQQVLRVDREPSQRPSDKTLAKLSAKLRAKLRVADAIAVSDYGFGVVSPTTLKEAAHANKRSPIITLDARYRLDSYANCNITAATPNEAELEALHHADIGSNLASLEKYGRATLRKMKLKSLLVTRGKDGMALFESAGRKLTQIPVHGSDQAIDVTGAGDTVLAVYTLALTSGASPLEAAQIANIAGGLVVMKRGTSVITRQELQAAIRAEISGGIT